MLKNYLTTGIRSLLRYPVYSFVNISSLVLGLTCSFLIFLWVIDELSYDKYDPDNDRVYKVLGNQRTAEGTISTDPSTPPALSAALKSEFPEVEETARFRWSQTRIFTANGKTSYEYGDYADGTFFKVLNIRVLEGNRDKPIPNINSIAISQKLALRYFAEKSAIGQSIKMDNNRELTVTAVYDTPSKASEEFDFVLPYELYAAEDEINSDSWDLAWTFTLVKLSNASMGSSVNARLQHLLAQKNKAEKTELFLAPMYDWRLRNHFENGIQSGGRISYVISFSAVALLIIVIACINFMNLSTARASSRSREVGVRKVTGATRAALIRQFMIESLLLSFVALGIAMLATHLLLPMFNDFTGKRMTIDYTEPLVSGFLLLITIGTGVVSGSYPALFLSSFNPSQVLKSSPQSRFHGEKLRRLLVVFQFALSIVIIICSFGIQRQIDFLRNKNLGFDTKNIVYLNTNEEISDNFEIFRNELYEQSEIVAVALGAADPMEINGGDKVTWSGKSDVEDVFFNSAYCDYDYINALNFRISAGRNFSRAVPSDSGNFIVTRRATEIMGLTDPIGRTIHVGSSTGTIIGVIDDFYNLGISEMAQPTVLKLGKSGTEFGRWATIFIRYMPGKTEETLAKVKEVYKKASPDFPIQFNFMDSKYENQFRSELLVGILSRIFTGMAIVISCLGLFGLALFSSEKRKKEISIRKVFGASVFGIITMLCMDFSKLVIAAILLGIPVSYYILTTYFSGQLFHPELSYIIFVVPALFLFLISLGIVSIQSFLAANQNPIETIGQD